MAGVVPRVASVQYISASSVCIREERKPTWRCGGASTAEALLGYGISEKNDAWPRPGNHVPTLFLCVWVGVGSSRGYLPPTAKGKDFARPPTPKHLPTMPKRKRSSSTPSGQTFSLMEGNIDLLEGLVMYKEAISQEFENELIEFVQSQVS